MSEKGDKFVGSQWEYEITVPQDVANDSQNSAIVAVFGPDGKLQDKHELNLQPKPGPTPSATPAASATPVSAPVPSATATPATTPSATAVPSASPTATASPTPQ